MNKITYSAIEVRKLSILSYILGMTLLNLCWTFDFLVKDKITWATLLINWLLVILTAFFCYILLKIERNNKRRKQQ